MNKENWEKELKDNLKAEFIEGDDELTQKLREFWFGNSPFVGMAGADFLKDLRDFIRQEKAKERQKFIEILERLKIEKQDDFGVYGFIESGYNQAVEEINQKIQEAINQLKNEK